MTKKDSFLKFKLCYSFLLISKLQFIMKEIIIDKCFQSGNYFLCTVLVFKVELCPKIIKSKLARYLNTRFSFYGA